MDSPDAGLPWPAFILDLALLLKGWLTQCLQGTFARGLELYWMRTSLMRPKDWLNTLSRRDLKISHVARKITSEVMGEGLYPRPHAFRHMWGEAVYRRFDGDAGWLIRSQSSNIAKTMWLAYIRNKDNRGIADSAQQQVINSWSSTISPRERVIRCHAQNLRRLMRAMDVKTPESRLRCLISLQTLRLSIKANPWGYCLLKRRTRHMAKCAKEFGEPNRVNAAPWAVFGLFRQPDAGEQCQWEHLHIALHVAALNNPKVPGIFKRQSFDLVKKVTKNVRAARCSHPALAEIEEALNNFKKEQEAAWNISRTKLLGQSWKAGRKRRRLNQRHQIGCLKKNASLKPGSSFWPWKGKKRNTSASMTRWTTTGTNPTIK